MDLPDHGGDIDMVDPEDLVRVVISRIQKGAMPQ